MKLDRIKIVVNHIMDSYGAEFFFSCTKLNQNEGKEGLDYDSRIQIEPLTDSKGSFLSLNSRIQIHIALPPLPFFFNGIQRSAMKLYAAVLV